MKNTSKGEEIRHRREEWGRCSYTKPDGRERERSRWCSFCRNRRRRMDNGAALTSAILEGKTTVQSSSRRELKSLPTIVNVERDFVVSKRQGRKRMSTIQMTERFMSLSTIIKEEARSFVSNTERGRSQATLWVNRRRRETEPRRREVDIVVSGHQ